MKETKVRIDSLQESMELNEVISANEKLVLDFTIDNIYSTFDDPTSTPTPTPPTTTSWLKSYLPSPIWITNYLPSSESIKNYVSWSKLGYGCAAILTTLPFLPYCLTSTPALISKEWWSSMPLAFMSGFEFIEKTIGSVYLHLTQKPGDIIKVVLMMGCCLLTAMSLMNAAKSISSRPNLFNLKANPDTFWQLIYLTLYIWGNYGVALALDMGACSKLLGLTDHSDPIPTMNNLIAWMESNPLSHDTLVGLKQHGFFTNAQASLVKNDIPLLTFNV